MLMSDMPTPKTLTVYLIPDIRDAYGRPLRVRGATLHRYSHTEERFVACACAADEEITFSDVSYRHIFVCQTTGATRVYGCEGPPSPGTSSDDEDDAV